MIGILCSLYVFCIIFRNMIIVFIFALRIQLAKCRKALFDLICFDRYFLNVGGWQRDLKCAFLGESGMSIRSR